MIQSLGNNWKAKIYHFQSAYCVRKIDSTILAERCKSAQIPILQLKAVHVEWLAIFPVKHDC